MRFIVRVMLSLFFFITSAAQANYSCIGTVIVSTVRGETLAAEFSYSPTSTTYLCVLTASANGISADQCKNVYAMLMAAQLSGRAVHMWYNDGLTCGTQPTWAYTTGWYHGPRLLE